MQASRVVVAAALSLALGVALSLNLAGGGSQAPPAAHAGAGSHGGLSSLPLSARGPISATLGADDAAYWITASGGGFQARNQAQRLYASFGRSGLIVSAGSTQVGLSVRAVGYGSSLVALGAVSPTVKANRVTYAHAGLSEWYANGPLGLEQGFTITRAPAGRPAAPLTISMGLSGNAQVSLAPSGQSLTLSRAGKTVVRYSGLSATDALGRVLHAWLSLEGGRLLLRVDTRGARYPLRIDPFVQQGGKLTGREQTAAGVFGWSAALSSDGDTALIGGPVLSGAGAAWVFTRSGSTWTQQGRKLTGGEETGAGDFGQSVALSAEGNIALIGGPGDNGSAGAAWVFTRSGSTWTQQGAKLTGGEEMLPFGEFGSSVALSSEGNTALIGGEGDSDFFGAAWVFTRSGSTWTQQGKKLTGGEETGGWFGYSVALSSEGNTALIGGPEDNYHVGAAWVFTRSGSTWTQQGKKLIGGEETGAGGFGDSVALSADGDTALIGGDGDNRDVGAAWVFTRSGSTWTQQRKKLTGGEETRVGEFGQSVALSSEGNTALIGGDGDNHDVGAAWVFTRSGSTWTQKGKKLTGGEEIGAGDFGQSVALSAEGNTALIGGRGDNHDVGAAWVFATRSKAEEEAAVRGRIKASLGGQLIPSGKGAKIAALLKSGGFSVVFKALEAGTAVIDWYYLPPGAKLAKKAKPKTVLVASGKRTLSAAGTATVKLKLTAAGKSLLRHAKKLKLTAKGSFTPTGKTPITATKTFVLTR